jgi:hypothetical protein
MLRRTRTTKILARRIDLQYFARPHPFRRWRLWMSVAVPVLALGWLLAQRAQGGQKAYSSGPLSHSHAMFSRQCNLCHIRRSGVFFEHVTDQACLACHDAPAHHASQTFTPQCSLCHAEHKGSARLAATSDASCVQCHGRLQTRNGQPRYAASIYSFSDGHPEFAPLRSGTPDPGRIKLNHFVHLQPNLIGPGNRRVQMTCQDCHRPETLAGEPWPYAAPGLRETSLTTAYDALPAPAPMVPPTFVRNCAGCHSLEFDRRFPGEQVPHDKSETIHAFLLKRFGEYIAAHPSAVGEREADTRQLPERFRTRPNPRNSAEWIQFRVEEAEWLLWAKTCKQCHTLTFGPNTLPAVVASNIRTRWLPHGEFEHRPHGMLSCTSCHSQASTSRETADVLLPGIQTCRDCHRLSQSSQDTAEARCFECHTYHDWSKAQGGKGRFTIPELRGMAELAVPQE